MLDIACISSNAKKLAQYQELHKILGVKSFTLSQKSIDLEEIQSVFGKEVILDKMAQIRKTTSLPFIVDDVSLTIDGYNYPGALVKHLLKNVPLTELHKFLPEGSKAVVTSYLGYFDGIAEHVFTGEVSGVMNYENLTAPTLDVMVKLESKFLGEIEVMENHRGKSFRALVDYMQSEMTKSQEHDLLVKTRWDDRATNWENTRKDVASYVNHEEGYARFNTELNRILPLVKGRALDIGCGDGEVTRLIASNPSVFSVRGIDISSDMIGVARKKTADSRVTFEEGLVSGEVKNYDLITSRGVVLSHMHKSVLLSTLQKIATALNSNGYLVIDYISNLSNADDAGRMPKNEISKAWLVEVFKELGLVNISFNGSDAHRVSTIVFHKPLQNSIYFATSNATKVLELQSMCSEYSIHLANIDVPEIKHDDVVEIAKDKAKKSYELLGHPVIVTDGGIFIKELGGFPGPNSKQAAMLLGPEGILKLLSGQADRSAVRRNCLVWYDGVEYKTCLAEVPLSISEKITTSDYPSYPLDTILIPVSKDNAAYKTYKEMPVEERTQFTELPSFKDFLATL